MRLIRCLDNHHQMVHAEQLNAQTFIRVKGSIETGFERTDEKLQPTKLLAPLAPVNIFAIGLNYADHASETHFDTTQNPVVFMKATSSVTHPFDPIITPACATRGPETDYEAELAVVIGKSAKNVSIESAMAHVFGYCCANDVSARRWQKHAGAGQWVRGKSFDTFCPLGPALVTRDEVPDPHCLDIRLELNGQIMQQSNTASMIYNIPTLISYLSQDTTLLPGTVILTGTPDGVGFVRKPPVFLQPGDTVKVTIDTLGVLENPVHAPEP
ncbi:MAG: fumarylacetoacetate hydrolase family protein [Deltaproteobacteria bacterium]|nr:fumarylacetoacetate hydrolase family protein [Deltaproteobacteria bacterium]MBN2670874.1 fumarylacetoacetate hydrolase family protein [Deltaproteobacteria bacterium]